ncbi:MAG: acetate--CoA ligase family protein [Alphaproteobacteria bacterium]|nr:acetate--CoA ligase family protein [Alphaproteobacteria bacterium]
MSPAHTSLDDLLNPKSIAIVGASDDKTRIGGRPVSHMIEQKFDGPVYPINPKRDRVQGLPAYPSLADIPGEIDFALIAVPAPLVADQVRMAGEKGAKTAMVFSSGFGEIGDDGMRMQEDLKRAGQEAGVRIIGPNCLGLFNSETRFYPTFSSTIDRATPVPGGISIASQSGAYGSHIYMASHSRGLGIRYWITTGNEADVNVAEVIKLLAEREDVHTIMAYAESIKDGDMLVDALETARDNRTPVIFMKVGRSAVGAAAASSHTASMAGEDAVYDAILRQYGAWRVKSTEEMLDVAYACRPRIYPAGRKLGLVTISGGAGVLMADAAEDYGLDVSPMPQGAQAELKSILPFASPSNPVDVTAQFFNDLSLIPRFTRMMLDSGGYDGLIGFWTSVAGSPHLGQPLLDYLTETMADYQDRLFLSVMLGPDEMCRKYDDAGFPNFEDPTRSIVAMAALMYFGEAFGKSARAVPALPAPADLGDGPLSEKGAKSVLAAAGLPMVEDRLATTAAEAEAIAAEIGGPLALKIASPDILHKTEVGGVKLGVVGGEEAGAAFTEIVASARAAMPTARIEGVILSPMIEGGVECILGARIDPVFGPVVLFGLGGVFTEVMKDVVFRRAPFGVDDAREMIERLKGVSVLKGARGQLPVDLDALAGAISNLSLFAAANGDRLESVEMNPLRALAKGCVALDALIEKKQES